ncbi:MAG: hypothetical protein DMF47_02170, partial [Verrucomicrobia bacterium]
TAAPTWLDDGAIIQKVPAGPAGAIGRGRFFEGASHGISNKVLTFRPWRSGGARRFLNPCMRGRSKSRQKKERDNAPLYKFAPMRNGRGGWGAFFRINSQRFAMHQLLFS